MGPSMRSDLVAFRDHALDDCRPVGINGAFTEIVSSDHECRLCAVNLQFV